MHGIAENLRHVQERIANACARSERDPSEVKLIAVSKKKSTALIREAYEAGQRSFGENYAQELRDKAGELTDLEIDWHFIGHLQRNKVKYIVPHATTIQTIDSIALAEALEQQSLRRYGEMPRKSTCLIEVNIGFETSKSGIHTLDILPLAERIEALPHLELAGLMIIPPYDSDPEQSRRYFSGLRGLLAELNATLAPEKPLKELSMGMSHDFEVAIEEGATIVRVGTAIFGER